MNIKLQSDNMVLLCCGKKGCPSVSKDGKDYIIKDDSGGGIKLTQKEIEMLPEALKALSTPTNG